jgi:hypothetical protein
MAPRVTKNSAKPQYQDLWTLTAWNAGFDWANGTPAAATSFLETQKVTIDTEDMPVKAWKALGWVALTEAQRIDDATGGDPGLGAQPDIAAILSKLNTKLNTVTAQLQRLQGRVVTLETEKEEVRKSLEFSHQQNLDLKTAMGDNTRLITKLTQDIIRLQGTADPEAEDRRRTLVVTGLAPGGTGGEAREQVDKLLGTHLQLELGLEVESVTQVYPGKQGGDGEQARPDRTLVRFKSRSTAQLVRGAATRLRQENVRRKTAGELTIGIDFELSNDERRCRSALYQQFKKARGEGKRCVWEGGKLFVDGREVLPSA